jgi:hypothetical protein
MELAVAGGDGQFGTPGQRLEAPLQALVRRVDTGSPQSGVVVEWSVTEGDAALVTAPVSTSDAQGIVKMTIELGTAAGRATVRAVLRDQPDAGVTFEAFVVDRPQVTVLSPLLVAGGDTLTMDGVGFSPVADQNVVLFSGIRGRVTSASAVRLRVEVPRCLPGGAVEVTAQLGTLVSVPRPLSVTSSEDVAPLPAGVPVDLEDAGGFECIRLPGGARYLLVVQSAGTVGTARYGFTVRGLASAGSAPAAERAPPRWDVAGHQAAPGVGERFEMRLRALEDALARTKPPPPASAPSAPSRVEAVPAVGSQRAFKVLNASGGFDDVRAVARLVSTHAALYVDETAPSGGFTEEELQTFAATFDGVIHPTVTGAFGATSDLDANERVVILFTPTVNRLTPRGSDGFIGGFFYGLDLLDRDGSNRGEVFYAMVPDSAGQFSDSRSRQLVLKVTPAILAHEFQHMIHFNERVLKLGAAGTEALWLSEGLAQMAEELVARVYLERGDPVAAEEYRAGNRVRARRYLSDPAAVSLIVATGQGSLAERGGGWLHVLYLWDRWGGDGVLGRMTRTTLTGVANVAAVAGEPWEDVLSDWGGALYAEGSSGGGYPFDFPSVRLRDLLRSNSPYPLSPETLGSGDFFRGGSLWSSSVRHYIVVPPSSGFTAVRLGGEAGGNWPAGAALRLRVIPLH